MCATHEQSNPTQYKLKDKSNSDTSTKTSAGTAEALIISFLLAPGVVENGSAILLSYSNI
jgi:hypothetical protein